MLYLARVYDATPAGVPRVLVTRHWPRGVSKDRVDRWYKDLGLHPEILTPWLKGELGVAEARAAYAASLAEPGAQAALQELATLALQQDICLLRSVADASRTHLPWVVAALAPVAAGEVGEVAQAERCLELLTATSGALEQVTLYRSTRKAERGGIRLHPVAHAVGQEAAMPLATGRPAPIASELAEWVASSGQTVVANNPEAEGRTMSCFAGAYAELIVPVKVAGEVVGVLAAESERPDPFTSTDRLLLEAVAAGLGDWLGRTHVR